MPECEYCGQPHDDPSLVVQHPWLAMFVPSPERDRMEAALRGIYTPEVLLEILQAPSLLVRMK